MVTVEVTKIVEGETITEIVKVTAEPPPPEKEMRENVLDFVLSYDDIPTLDPSLGTDTSSIQVIEEITIGLTRLDDKANLLPGMAQTSRMSFSSRRTNAMRFAQMRRGKMMLGSQLVRVYVPFSPS